MPTIAPRACSRGAAHGRWVGHDWAPLHCFLLRYTRPLLARCTEASPLRIELYGDSIMRGLYFDLAELLTEQKLDRAWAKRHAGAGKGVRLTLTLTLTRTPTPTPHPGTPAPARASASPCRVAV